MGKASELIAQLRDEAEVVDRGAFSLDAEAALEKLAAYQLDEPHRYVLHLLEGLIVLGAPSIEIRQTGADLFVEVPTALPLSAEQLQRVYAAVMDEDGERRNRGLRRLGIALNAAGSLGISDVAIHVCDGESATLATYAPGKPPFVGKGKPKKEVTTVLVDRPFKDDLVATVTGKVIPEIELLREHARWVSIPLRINDETVGGGPPEPLGMERIEGEGWSGVVGFEPGAFTEQEAIHFLTHGVEVERYHPGSTVDFKAYVEVPDMKRDASQSAMVRDRTYDAVLKAVRQAKSVCRKRLKVLEERGALPPHWNSGRVERAVR